MEIITNIVTSELSCNRSMNSFLNSAEFIQCKYGDETVCIIRMDLPRVTATELPRQRRSVRGGKAG